MDTLQTSPLPSRHAVRTLVEDLVNRTVDLLDSDPVPPKSTNVVAVYVNDRLQVTALVVTTLEGGARLGGALGMLPRGGVDDAIDERELPEMIHDCCYEVLNVMASVFNVPNAPHVRLYQMYGPGDAVPPDVAQLAAMVGNRMDVKMTITGYGEVWMSVIVKF